MPPTHVLPSVCTASRHGAGLTFQPGVHDTAYLLDAHARAPIARPARHHSTATQDAPSHTLHSGRWSPLLHYHLAGRCCRTFSAAAAPPRASLTLQDRAHETRGTRRPHGATFRRAPLAHDTTARPAPHGQSQYDPLPCGVAPTMALILKRHWVSRSCTTDQYVWPYMWNKDVARLEFMFANGQIVKSLRRPFCFADHLAA